MLTTHERTKLYRELLHTKWQHGIEQIILKYNRYIDCNNLLKYVSLDFIEKYYITLKLSLRIAIYDNVNITEEFILKHAGSNSNSNMDLYLYMFRENKNISFAFWKKNYEQFITSHNNFRHNHHTYDQRLSKCFAQIASLTINDVLQNDWDWDYRELALHPNIHCDDIIKHINLFRINEKDLYDMSETHIYSTIYKNPTLRINHILKLGTYYLTSDMRVLISINPNITEAHVKRYIHEPIWNFLMLLKNKNLSDDFILTYIYPKINFESLCHKFMKRDYCSTFTINPSIYEAFKERQNIKFILNAPAHAHSLLCRLDYYIYKFIKLYPELPWQKDYIVIYNSLTTYEFNKICKHYIDYFGISAGYASHHDDYYKAMEFVVKYIDLPDIKLMSSCFVTSLVFNTLFDNPTFTLEYLIKNSKFIYNLTNKRIYLPIEYIDKEYNTFINKHIRRYIAARQIQRAWATAIYDPQYKLCHEIQYKRYTGCMGNLSIV